MSLGEFGPSMHDELRAAVDRAEALQIEVDRLSALLNTPELHDFAKAVLLEAAHQRERWPAGHDTQKTDEDWFWLIGYLAGKALHTPIRKDFANSQRYDEERDIVLFGLRPWELREKQLHRIITIAAAAANWHAARLPVDTTPSDQVVSSVKVQA